MKIILFDVDGVLIRLPHYYSVELENQGYKNAVAILNSFYQGKDNHLCNEGRANLEKMILPYLRQFGWTDSAKELLRQQFQFESQYLDTELISFIQRLRRQGNPCYLCTDQEPYRTKYLLKNLDFQTKFDGCFVSCEIRSRKCHGPFWTHTLDVLQKKYPQLTPGEIAFFDDVVTNIDAALTFGIRAFWFKDINRLYQDLENFLSL